MAAVSSLVRLPLKTGDEHRWAEKVFTWANNPWTSKLPGQHPYNTDFYPLRGSRFKQSADFYSHQASHQTVPAFDHCETGPDLDWSHGPEVLSAILQPPGITHCLGQFYPVLSSSLQVFSLSLILAAILTVAVTNFCVIYFSCYIYLVSSSLL